MVIIMRGASGSGKSTLAMQIKLYINGLIPECPSWKLSACRLGDYVGRQCKTVSSDYYFTDSNGEYKFDSKFIGDAHKTCLRDFIFLLSDGETGGGNTVIIVDNTNTSVGEVAPYSRVASAFGHDVIIVEVPADLETCVSRNTHGVPRKTIKNQLDNIERSANMMDRYCDEYISIHRNDQP